MKEPVPKRSEVDAQVFLNLILISYYTHTTYEKYKLNVEIDLSKLQGIIYFS